MDGLQCAFKSLSSVDVEKCTHDGIFWSYMATLSLRRDQAVIHTSQ